jgi:thioredoxin
MQEVTRDTFADEVLQSDRPVLVDFWGPECGPCLKLMPAVEELARELEGQLKVVKVEAPKNRRLCIDLRVMALPTFLVFAAGAEVKRLAGEVNRQQLFDVARELAGDTVKTTEPVSKPGSV